MSRKMFEARKRAGLTQAEVAAPIEVSQMWVSLAERGKVPVSADMERRVLAVIARLSRLKDAIRASKSRIVEDLRLPRAAGGSIR